MSSKINLNSRVDQVGSLLRQHTLKDAYARYGNGELGDSELGRMQDQSVEDLIAKQESQGLPILTAGEYRRLNFQERFVESVSGFIPKKQTMQFKKSQTVGGEALQRWVPDSQKTDSVLQYWRVIAERLRLTRDVPLREWRSASALTSDPVKVTLITTDRIYENFKGQNTAGVYARADNYRADVIASEREIVNQLAAAVYPYIQHDAPSYTAYVDVKALERTRAMDEASRVIALDQLTLSA